MYINPPDHLLQKCNTKSKNVVFLHEVFLTLYGTRDRFAVLLFWGNNESLCDPYRIVCSTNLYSHCVNGEMKMKKVLLSSAAVALGLALAAPAHAEGVKLDLAGHFKGYVSYVDQDMNAGVDNRNIDIFRETEIHFTGETTLDNGLTVGFHAEADADGADSFNLDESYAYFSGSWGRVNFGEEDGAAYLLQVAAPSADSNIDGLRQYINPINYTSSPAAGGVPAASEGIDYDNDFARNAEKITYLTPVLSGFQAGVSYTPDLASAAPYGGAIAGSNTNTIYTTNADNVNNQYGSVYEAALRYEGQFEDVGVTAGAGYTVANLENEPAGGANDDFQEWNVGLALDFMAFGFGAVYTENNNGLDANDKNETWVVGLDYTTGAFKLGASYLNNTNDMIGTDVDTDRYTGGVVYTYGPGMTFRGSVSYIEHETTGVNFDATSVLLGTQINF